MLGESAGKFVILVHRVNTHPSNGVIMFTADIRANVSPTSDPEHAPADRNTTQPHLCACVCVCACLCARACVCVCFRMSASFWRGETERGCEVFVFSQMSVKG